MGERSGLRAVEARGEAPALRARGLEVESDSRPLLRGVDLEVEARQVLAVIGPSGAGKSTLLKCFNRLIELSPGLRMRGQIELEGESIESIPADALRARIGMLFQQPAVFPRSIYQNVIFGVRHLRREPKRRWPEIAERALRDAALWDEVRDRLREPANQLSVGQQQRLCLARALASDPQVLLMDEPTSALDPRSTQAIEERVVKLGQERAVVLVTHDVAQARRVADRVACVCPVDGVGELVESASCAEFLERPQSPAAAEYLRFAQR